MQVAHASGSQQDNLSSAAEDVFDAALLPASACVHGTADAGELNSPVNSSAAECG